MTRSARTSITAAVAVELVHAATLCHDDVMDEATMRRGAVSANAKWNNSVAILAGDYLFAHASRLVSDLGTDAARIIAETFAELVAGQMRETVGPINGADPIEHYLSVIGQKTGSLIATAGRYGGMCSGAAQEHIVALRRFGEIIGAMFQISDDIIDIASPADESGKTPGTDLREGVRTLPMLYALADPDEANDRLRHLLSAPLTDDAEVDEALTLLRDSAALLQARKTLAGYADRARAQLESLPSGAARDALRSLDRLHGRTHRLSDLNSIRKNTMPRPGLAGASSYRPSTATRMINFPMWRRRSSSPATGHHQQWWPSETIRFTTTLSTITFSSD